MSKNAPFEQTLDEFFKMLAAKSNTGPLVLVAPIIYPAHFSVSGRARCGAEWDKLKEGYGDRILFISRLTGLKVQQDGIHLTEGAAKKFIKHVVTNSLDFFATQAVNQT